MTAKNWLALIMVSSMVFSPAWLWAEDALKEVGSLMVQADQRPDSGDQGRRYLESGVSGLDKHDHQKRLLHTAEEAMNSALTLKPANSVDPALRREARERVKRQEAIEKPAAEAGPLKLAAAPPAGSLNFAPLNHVWLKGFGNWATQQNKSGRSGYDFDHSGLVFGYDREIDIAPGLVLGLSGSMSSGELKSKLTADRADIDFQTLAFYGRYNLDNGLFARVNLALGRSDNATKYTGSDGARHKSDFDTEAYQMGFSFGYIYHDPIGFRVIPSVGLQYFHLKQKGWNSNLALADPAYGRLGDWYDIDRDNQIQFPVRLKADIPIEIDRGIILTPEIRLGLIVDTHKPRTIMRMGFQDSGYDGQVIYGIEPGVNRFQVGTGVKAQVNEVLDIFLDYQFDFRQKYTNHNASGGLGLSF